MINKTFFKSFFLLVTILVISSCDKDFNSIGGDLVGNENFLLDSQDFTVKAYNQKVGAVETNNLPINPIGIINSSIFGKTRANFVTQLEIDPRNLNTVFSNAVIDSVVLSLPYLSNLREINVDGSGIYDLQSTYSDNANQSNYQPIDLKVYENGYYLRDFDPSQNNETRQKFFSDENPVFDGAKLQLLGGETSFTASAKQIVIFKVDSTVNKSVVPYVREYTSPNDPTKLTRQIPGLRLKLDNDFFKTKIIEGPRSNLSNNNAFKNYMKGLYFKVEDAAAGSLYNLDFTRGRVTIYYKEDLLTTLDGQSFNSKPRKTFVMNIAGNSASLLDNTDNGTYATAANSPNTAAGDNLLYLKGGQGSQAFIELFSANELADLRVNKWLINYATLSFTIDDNYIANSNKPNPLRLYLYNADTNIPIADYNLDISVNAGNPKLNKVNYGGFQNGNKFVLNITEHINTVINAKAENVRLGLVVTDNIALIGNAALKTPITAPRLFNKIPAGSVVSPLGIVFYGSNALPAFDDKKVKFKIYYTKPN